MVDGPAGKGERTRARLLEIAVRRFAHDGYRATSVSAIAREAGITPGAAYAYFDGKEELFAAAVDADAGALIEHAHAAAPAGPLRGRVPLIVAALGRGLADHPLARRVLAGREPEVVGRLLALPSLAALRDEIAQELLAGLRAGELRADLDPAVVALGLETIVLALLMGALQSGEAPDSERAEAVLAVLDAALRPPA